MKFLAQCETNARTNRAQTHKLKNVVVKDLGSLLEAIERDGLLSETQYVRTEQGVQWGNQIGKGGIKIVSSKHPLMERTFDLEVSGDQDNICLFEQVLLRYATYRPWNPETFFEVVQPEEVDVEVKYHSKLNPNFWEETEDGQYKLKEKVKKALLKISEEFFKYLKMPEMHIVDIVITGSNANFNYTDQSDLDLHVVINVEQAEDKYGTITKEYLDAKKRLWNDTHDITIHGHAVELYVQDEDEPHIASAIYSLKKDQWAKEPKFEKPDFSNSSVQRKAAFYMNAIDELTEENDSCNPKAADELVDKLKKYRKAGLATAGEFSTENLVFKLLRNNGYIEKLMKCRTKGADEQLSVEDEEWWR